MKRRTFLKAAAAGGVARTAVAANDRLQFALIGAGGMGSSDVHYALSYPGVEIVAAGDIYQGRLTRAQEVWGKHVFTSRDYREVLARRDVDCVIVATPDHWHAQITLDALAAGKDVYCEKPLVHDVTEGRGIIAAQQRSGRILQVGSQYVTSLVYHKARQLLDAGAIGKLTMVEAWLDRNSALGAWQYSIPPDASPQNVDWDRFLGKAPRRPFDPIRLFRWRNYKDYGTGVAGDLFVHLLSAIHFATRSSGPNRVFATGGLRYWRDGRDVPDFMVALLDYPAFTVSLRVNLKTVPGGEPFGFRFIGTEGVLKTNVSGLTLAAAPPEKEPGYTITTFPEAVQMQFLEGYRRRYPESVATVDDLPRNREETFTVPPGYNAHREHHGRFLEAVRSRKQPVEDAVFGFRAAGPALLCNRSQEDGRICRWDPDTMTPI